MKLSKADRQSVYNKFHGHCAYCGCELEYKDMQVDHVDSAYRFGELQGQNVDTMENYFPACRICNFYKSTFTVEEFRERLSTVTNRLGKIFIYRIAKKYGMIKEEPKKMQFYFERERSGEDG